MERITRRAVQAVSWLLLLYGLTAMPDLAARWGFSLASVAVAAVWIALAAPGFALLRAPPSVRMLAVLGSILLVLRMGAALLGAGRDSTGDPYAYLILAKHVVAGEGLFIHDPFFGSVWHALFPPLYPLVLAAWGAACGFSTPSLLALGTLTDGAAAWLIARLGARLGSASAGRRAAWLYLLWPSTLLSAPLAQKESLCALLVLALALAWLRREPGWRGALALGVPAGLLALTQPGEAPLAGLFGLVLVGRVGLWPVLLAGLRAGVVAAIVLVPWWIRNALLLHAFVPLTTAGGVSLWIGNNPVASGNWLTPPAALRGVPELAYGKRIAAIAIDWIRAHPVDFVRLTAAKVVRAGGIGVFGVTRLAAMQPPLLLPLAAALWPLGQGAHLALLGAAGARTSRVPLTLVLLIAGCGLHMLLFGMWFEFGERHREFATPFLLLALCWTLAAPTPDTHAANAGRLAANG